MSSVLFSNNILGKYTSLKNSIATSISIYYHQYIIINIPVSIMKQESRLGIFWSNNIHNAKRTPNEKCLKLDIDVVVCEKQDI